MKKSYFIVFSLLFSSFALAQTDIKIKDVSSNILLQIDDEGTAGSQTLLSLGSISYPGNKLYELVQTCFGMVLLLELLPILVAGPM